jgi:hypothetical protein
MGFDMVILTPYKVNGSFLPNDRLHKNSYTLLRPTDASRPLKNTLSTRLPATPFSLHTSPSPHHSWLTGDPSCAL